MPTFSRNLQQTLDRAVASARERRQEYATLEHLLLSLIEDADASAVLRACSVDLDLLAKNLRDYIDRELDHLVNEDAKESTPTAGFQRVTQRAVLNRQAAGREDVNGADVLVALFAEQESHAVYFLQEQDMTRYDAMNYISHGGAKRPGLSDQAPRDADGPDRDSFDKESAYRVLMLNDDYTTQEFVVAVLRKYFDKSPDEAVRVMLDVHQHGAGECGAYAYEVAETKITQVMDFARKHRHPLQCIMEKK